jgi:undecaprenyl-diphosphatase
MTWIQALILGILQGITEFLPVSSSGHLVIGKELFGVGTQGVAFEMAVHAATVLSIITVFWREILKLLGACCRFTYNEELRTVYMLLISMVPILVVGLFFRSGIESLFGSGLGLVGLMLLVTAALLWAAQRIPKKTSSTPFKYRDAFIIGLSQAVAVLPGLSRSGATISTGLLLGKDR